LGTDMHSTAGAVERVKMQDMMGEKLFRIFLDELGSVKSSFVFLDYLNFQGQRDSQFILNFFYMPKYSQNFTTLIVSSSISDWL